MNIDEVFALSGAAIVTGASSGIGEHTCRLLSAAGMTVVAAARRADRLAVLESETSGVIGHVCDVSDDGQLEELVAAAERLGPLTVVVNNAGISDATTPAIEQDPADFRRVMEVNLTATFVLSKLAAATMIDADRSGSIVNVSSVHGLVAAAPNHQAAYVASKSAVVGLTRELALQWARQGVRVNAIAPGYFPTELTEAMLVDDDSGLRYVRRNTPLGRTGELAELDGVLLLLASAAGSYITGQTIAVDGGWTAR